ncbi:hypothetical protein GDO78_009585 [Eleutherodactylus coqui]|uniref:Uncharacterized protein n=1 Tax=Eleutherodactylus coqui TaxID=57060 RepID=A0A8J6FBH6_ELECQ|nr:hypothetical protein GDO78_009585 [Eleutherodactylus coqui]
MVLHCEKSAPNPLQVNAPRNVILTYIMWMKVFMSVLIGIYNRTKTLLLFFLIVLKITPYIQPCVCRMTGVQVLRARGPSLWESFRWPYYCKTRTDTGFSAQISITGQFL